MEAENENSAHVVPLTQFMDNSVRTKWILWLMSFYKQKKLFIVMCVCVYVCVTVLTNLDWNCHSTDYNDTYETHTMSSC